jgi:hypothetical protein
MKLRNYIKRAILENANVKVQNTSHRQNNITCSTNCKYITAAHLETLLVSGI